MKITEKNIAKLNEEELENVSGGSVGDVLKNPIVWKVTWQHINTAL